MPWEDSVKQEVLQKAKETLQKTDGGGGCNLSPGEQKMLDFRKPLKDVNSMLAHEMAQMSIDERETLYEELHGVQKVPVETPDFVNPKIQQMRQALEATPLGDKKVYMLAERRDRSYLQDSNFLLGFLRATSFNPSKAAKRLVAFLENRLKHFGPETLTRSLRLSDLDEDDLKTLKSGLFQVLPSRDRAGRAVICRTMPQELPWEHPNNAIKAFAYILSTLAEDEENQKHGIVFIGYQMGPYIRINPGLFDVVKGNSQSGDCASVRLVGIHIRFENPVALILVSIFLSTIDRGLGGHYRLHEGTHQEALYSLLSFGLPIEMMPYTVDGTLKVKEHGKWIARRKVKEQILERGEPFVRVDLPKRTDILCGKGRPIQQHHGNVMMREVIESRLAEYQAMRRRRKGSVSVVVFETLSNAGVRFLKRDRDGWWTEVTKTEACQKIMNTLVSKAGASKRKDVVERRVVSSFGDGLSKRARLFSDDGCCSRGCTRGLS